jgi:hypothetical protein
MSFILSESKEDYLEFVHYEFWMLNSIQLENIDSLGLVEKNIRIEAFLLHVRNLLDFLEDKRREKDDLTCSDFESINGNKISPFKVSLNNKTREKINKHLSHITKMREKEKVYWSTDHIKTEINNIMGAFLEQINPSYFPTKNGIKKEDFIKLFFDSWREN